MNAKQLHVLQHGIILQEDWVPVLPADAPPGVRVVVMRDAPPMFLNLYVVRDDGEHALLVQIDVLETAIGKPVAVADWRWRRAFEELGPRLSTHTKLSRPVPLPPENA